MRALKKGDIVGRISYNKDIVFEIKSIINISNDKKIAILKGITERIEADSYLDDLELMDKRDIEVKVRTLDVKMQSRINECLEKSGQCISKAKKWLGLDNKENRSSKIVYTGKILHLDGDKRYAEKSVRYYRSLGLNAIVRSISENRQSMVVENLLDKYNPDILVITGHDGMIKKQTAYNDIYNYRNSKYFINTVSVAREWCKSNRKDLSIFAGACQSYYEAIILAGANFASSPARIMIDFIDPLIVAERIATTENTKYLTINDIEEELRDGKNGVSGVGTMGKKKILGNSD